jgi:hypothetical protein
LSANNPFLFLRNPEWHFLFDVDGPLAVQTRRKVYYMVIAEKMLICGFHWPFPAVGHVEKDGNCYRLLPATWNTIL